MKKLLCFSAILGSLALMGDVQPQYKFHYQVGGYELTMTNIEDWVRFMITNNLAGKRDLNNNISTKTVYGDWVVIGGDDYSPIDNYSIVLTASDQSYDYTLYKNGDAYATRHYEQEVHDIDYFNTIEGGDVVWIHAIHRQVSTAGEEFVTQSFVSNLVIKSGSQAPVLRTYDRVRKCYWLGYMVNGIIEWEVE